MQVLVIKKFQDVRIAAFIVSLAYLYLFYFMAALKTENIIIAATYNLLLTFNGKVRKFMLAFTVFIIFGLLYDLLKLWPNYLFNHVDIANLYLFEKENFGLFYNGRIITPNEYFAAHNAPFLDLLTGIIYFNWVPIPLAFGIWLYFRNKKLFLNYSMAFLLVNLLGFCVYYIHPAAPPWYVQDYGFEFQRVTGDPAALGRFDAMVGFPLFESIYSRNSNVFAALPSLHCAKPVVLLFYGFIYIKPHLTSPVKNLRLTATTFLYFLVLFMLGIWFSAVYTNHHYVTDVILGVTCAITGLLIYNLVLLKIGAFNRFVERYYKLVQ